MRGAAEKRNGGCNLVNAVVARRSQKMELVQYFCLAVSGYLTKEQQ